MILSAEEHRQNKDCPARLVNVEPVDRPAERQMPQARQEVVMALAPIRRGEGLAPKTNRPSASCETGPPE